MGLLVVLLVFVLVLHNAGENFEFADVCLTDGALMVIFV